MPPTPNNETHEKTCKNASLYIDTTEGFMNAHEVKNFNVYVDTKNGFMNAHGCKDARLYVDTAEQIHKST